MKYYNTFSAVKFNLRSKRVKHLNLEKLSRPAADFARHLNFVFSGTPYGICAVDEDEYIPTEKGEQYRLDIDITLYKLADRSSKFYEKVIGNIFMDLKGDKIRFSLFECNKNQILENYEEKIKNYDFSKIR